MNFKLQIHFPFNVNGILVLYVTYCHLKKMCQF